jgi:tetratricopeptide (TPR) repeat protein
MRKIIILAFIFTMACKTNEGKDGIILDGTDLPGEIMTEDDEGATVVPMSLWSPEQRRATAGYYFLVAEKIAFKEREAKNALKLYEASYNMDPNAFLGGKMVAAKAASGEKETALSDAHKLVLLYPQNALLRYLYGRMLSELGNYPRAEKELEISLDLDPTYEPSYLELIALHKRTGSDTKALLIIEQLTKEIPSSVNGWSGLSRFYLANGQYKKALVPAKRAFEMQPGNPTVIQIYAILLQLNGKKKQAVKTYEQLYRLNPADEQLTAQMVELYRQVGSLDEALSLIDEMLGSTSSPALEMQKTLLLWELKRFDEASDLLRKLVSQYPESDRVKYMYAVSVERKEKYEEAIEAYNDIAVGSEFHYRALFRIVVILSTQKKYEEAISRSQALLEHPKVEWDAFRLLGGVYADAKQYKEAVTAFSDGYEKFPDNHRLLFLKGVYQEKAEDIDGCIETMRLVIKNDPTNSSAYNYLGYLFADRGENLKEAERLIKKALELKPKDGFYLDSLGWVYFRMGQYNQAKPVLEKALKLQPKEGVILEHLGDVVGATGDKKKAQEYYLKALKENLDDKDRKRVESKLEKDQPVKK